VIHLEARSRDSRIVIGPSTVVNNGAVFISAGPGIQIGQDVLIGPGVHIYDSDFHPLDYALRGVQLPRRGAVDIGDGCFIGARATICKGVRIGSNAVVGAGSVVSSDVPADGIVGGAPARLLRFVDGQAVHEPAIEGEAL
jgi:maltose O-acetyltransferase